MSLPKGKLSQSLLRRLVLKNLPMVKKPLELDSSSIRKAGKIVACVDPVAGVPPDFYGFFAVHYPASDIAVRGAIPKYLLVDINYPEGTNSNWLYKTTRMLGAEARKHGIKVLGGHTGSYDGISLPFISSTCIGYAPRQALPGPGSVKEGDVLMIVGQLCLESAWLIASVRSRLVEERVGRQARRRISRKMNYLTALPKALVALKLGSKCLHDITEGGLAAALHELCNSTGKSILVEESKLTFDEDSLSLIKSLGGDPLSASSFGALLIIASQRQAEKILSARGKFKEKVSLCGHVERGSGPFILSGNRKSPLRIGGDIYQRFSKELLMSSWRH